jgi:ATP-dependent DNA helicase RecG
MTREMARNIAGRSRLLQILQEGTPSPDPSSSPMSGRCYEATNAPVRIYWYDDRIEITSPGGPFGIVSPENFGQPGVTDYRNPNLAEAMRVLGFVQHFGAGIPTARQALAKNGNPPPEFDVQPAYLGVIVRAAP